MVDTNIPQADPRAQQEYTKKKEDLGKAFKEFHQLLNNKVLDKNKTPAVKNVEKQAVDTLIKTATSLDNINVGEGILALSSIAVRELLKARDRINELEYELCLMRRDFLKLQKELGVDNESK
jgi:hypothetical protein